MLESLKHQTKHLEDTDMSRTRVAATKKDARKKLQRAPTFEEMVPLAHEILQSPANQRTMKELDQL